MIVITVLFQIVKYYFVLIFFLCFLFPKAVKFCIVIEVNIRKFINYQTQSYSNPILFVAKILLLFREQATGNRQQATSGSFNFFIYFLITRNLFRIAIDYFGVGN